jgi:integrase/recombinase XerD
MLSRIKAAFKFFCENEWVSKSPAVLVRAPKPPKGEVFQKQPFAQHEIEKLMSSATTLFGEESPEKTAFLTMLYSGLRISDAVMLRSEHLEGDTLTVRTIKTGSKVTVPLPADLVRRLNAINPVDGYFFARGSLRMQTQTDSLRRKFNECAKLAGVSKATPHRLRHTYAVSALLAGLSTDTVSKMLGHSSPSITSKFYSAFTREREKALVDEVRQLWDLPKAA